MPRDSRNLTEEIHEGILGSLGGCLIEGSPEQRRRERRLRRRALLFSMLIEAAVLAALILLPWFGKTERLALAASTPVPPYSPYRGASRNPAVPHPRRASRGASDSSARPNIPLVMVTHPSDPSGEGPNDVPQGLPLGIPGAPVGMIPVPEVRTPVPPPPSEQHVARPTVVRNTHLDPAMLIHRVEPIYPALPKMLHKEGRVELHARISTDGSIQSLEVVGGDPMFFPSALEAVRQWRYRPPILNGQAVEIDTHITVIYTMPH